MKERYQSQVEYVAGEFYWQVQRGATTYHRGFASGKNVMSEETTQNEVTWSAGEMEASVVAKAFKMEEKGGAFKRADAAPSASPPHLSLGTLVLLGVMVMFVLPMLLPRCSQCDPKVENCSASGSPHLRRFLGWVFRWRRPQMIVFMCHQCSHGPLSIQLFKETHHGT